MAVGGSTVYRTKRRFVEGNLEAALNEEAAGKGRRRVRRPGMEDVLDLYAEQLDPKSGR